MKISVGSWATPVKIVFLNEFHSANAHQVTCISSPLLLGKFPQFSGSKQDSVSKHPGHEPGRVRLGPCLALRRRRSGSRQPSLQPWRGVLPEGAGPVAGHAAPSAEVRSEGQVPSCLESTSSSPSCLLSKSHMITLDLPDNQGRPPGLVSESCGEK